MPTDDEVEERVEFARGLLARHNRKSTVKRLMREKFGEMDARTIERYLSRARRRMLADIGRGRDDLRAESKAMYSSIISDNSANHFARLKAQERIDKLLGL
jgi:hypothetical protein